MAGYSVKAMRLAAWSAPEVLPIRMGVGGKESPMGVGGKESPEGSKGAMARLVIFLHPRNNKIYFVHHEYL